MKKFLLIAICCVLCVSFGANAKEYKGKETKECGENLLCDLNGSLITGTVKYYYENGGLWMEIPYKKGKKEGLEKMYAETGTLAIETPYKGGKENGIEIHYDGNGNLWEEIPYKNGKEEGIAKWYYENGKLQKEISFKKGKKEGTVKIYDENGKLLADIITKNDEAISGFSYSKNGNQKIKIQKENLTEWLYF